MGQGMGSKTCGLIPRHQEGEGAHEALWVSGSLVHSGMGNGRVPMLQQHCETPSSGKQLRLGWAGAELVVLSWSHTWAPCSALHVCGVPFLQYQVPAHFFSFKKGQTHILVASVILFPSRAPVMPAVHREHDGCCAHVPLAMHRVQELQSLWHIGERRT